MLLILFPDKSNILLIILSDKSNILLIIFSDKSDIFSDKSLKLLFIKLTISILLTVDFD